MYRAWQTSRGLNKVRRSTRALRKAPSWHLREECRLQARRSQFVPAWCHASGFRFRLQDRIDEANDIPGRFIFCGPDRNTGSSSVGNTLARCDKAADLGRVVRAMSHRRKPEPADRPSHNEQRPVRCRRDNAPARRTNTHIASNRTVREHSAAALVNPDATRKPAGRMPFGMANPTKRSQAADSKAMPAVVATRFFETEARTSWAGLSQQVQRPAPLWRSQKARPHHVIPNSPRASAQADPNRAAVEARPLASPAPRTHSTTKQLVAN